MIESVTLLGVSAEKPNHVREYQNLGLRQKSLGPNGNRMYPVKMEQIIGR